MPTTSTQLCIVLHFYLHLNFAVPYPIKSTFSVIWDSGASILVSYDKHDFVGPLKKPGFATQLKGIAKGL